jgi:hypothetical protein
LFILKEVIHEIIFFCVYFYMHDPNRDGLRYVLFNYFPPQTFSKIIFKVEMIYTLNTISLEYTPGIPCISPFQQSILDRKPVFDYMKACHEIADENYNIS